MKLTKEQNDFAEKHHCVVMEYLRENGLSEDEFYDVVIFGYLFAVHNYFERVELCRYAFKTIAYKEMDSALRNYMRT